ncbi:MAG: phosphate ABC transporter permease PstA [Sedimentisphaerales bacterium]|nr:phosphate ABC transporter permease PstA [Sedimentisphaerales bacterium]
MKADLRIIIDKLFTSLTGLAIASMIIALFVILGPMLYRGFGAIVFRGTVEFRKMQIAEFHHGNAEKVKQEAEKTQKVRQVVYDMIHRFRNGIDIEELENRVKDIHRNYGNELQQKDISREQYKELRDFSKEIRDKLIDTFSSDNIEKIKENIDFVLQYEMDERFVETVAIEYFTIARDFLKSSAKIDFEKRDFYAAELEELEDIILRLLGPAPDADTPMLAQKRYGATRLDQTNILFHQLFWKEKWVEQENSVALIKIENSRPEQFAGTELEPLFGYIKDNIKQMLNPKLTFYWRYFFDDSTPGHYFGGIGPEIFGTLLLTLLSMIFVIPFGVISAAYLTECTKEGPVVRIIRMCINTLAGVPSIVFGLFGMAFFVLFFIPIFGGPSQPCILAGSLTLAVLTLPVMIRASEEAIKTVPQTYKEASLALGASKFLTFVKVTLPAALPGILTGIILSLSRVAGETAPILFTAGIAIGPIPKSIFQTTRTLSYGSWDMAVSDKLAAEVPHNQFGMVVTLVLLILCLNAMAIILRARVFKKLKGH